MFTKIDIKKFGLYKDFMWGGLPELGRVNIIYGRNYSGKTTLSRIFDSISQGQLHKNYLDGEFTLYGDGVTIKESNMADCPYAIRVYNSDYVSRNLSWLRNEEEGEILPFTLIGSDNVEAQKAIDEIDEKLGSVEEKKGLLYQDEVWTKEYKAKKQKYDENMTWLENQLRDKANGDIKRKNYYVRQGTNYNVNSIKGDISEILSAEAVETEDESGRKKTVNKYSLDDTVVLTDEQKEQLKKTIDEAQKPEISKLPVAEPHLNDYETQVRELVTKKITLTKTLQELVENALLQAWVDQGRELNKERKTCAFCGNPITEERWEALNAHFSKESEELKKGLMDLRETLTAANSKLDGYLESKGFTKENIYVPYTAKYDEVIEKWNVYVDGYKKAIEKLVAIIDERLNNLFVPVVYELEAFDVTLKPILEEINALIEQNNQYGLKQENEKGKARVKLRHHVIYHFCTDIHYTEVLEKLEKEEAELKDMEHAVFIRAAEIGDLRRLRKQKELDKKDEGLAAQKVTELLKNHFGNGSLSLEPEQVDGEEDAETGERKLRTRFVVKRGGVEAKNLSEGERSLISFCYFIAQMADELKGPDAGNLVVYIDDPISSLDSSHIFFMYSLIETVFVKHLCFGQLFISTHNLEFLKFTKRIKPVVTTGSKSIVKYVVVKLGKGATNDYKCEIRQMPEYLSKYMAEYNFLFEQIYEIAMLDSEKDRTLYDKQYTLYYNIGNNMRRFLECYLFNRYPNTDDPLRFHLADMFDDHVPSEVNRVVNEYSHLVWAERGMRVMDVPEVVTAAREILMTLQRKDKKHYDVLCKSVGKDETVVFS